MLDRPFPAAAEGLPKFSNCDLDHEDDGPATQAMASILEDGLEAGQEALTILALCHASMAYDPTDTDGEHPDLTDDIAKGTLIATRLAEKATQAMAHVLGHFDRGARVDISRMNLGRGEKV